MGVRWRGVLSTWDSIQTSLNLPEQLSLCPSRKVGLVSRAVSVPAPGGGGRRDPVCLCPVAPGKEARCEDRYFLPWLPPLYFLPSFLTVQVAYFQCHLWGLMSAFHFLLEFPGP